VIRRKLPRAGNKLVQTNPKPTAGEPRYAVNLLNFRDIFEREQFDRRARGHRRPRKREVGCTKLIVVACTPEDTGTDQTTEAIGKDARGEIVEEPKVPAERRQATKGFDGAGQVHRNVRDTRHPFQAPSFLELTGSMHFLQRGERVHEAKASFGSVADEYLARI
jgi:hypothetical protein